MSPAFFSRDRWFQVPRGAVLPALAVTMLVISRMMPHAPNFTPVLAIALWLGATGGRAAIGWVLMAMLATDLVIGVHAVMPAVYLSISLAVVLGRTVVGDATGAGRAVRVTASVGLSAMLFFVVTNAACWVLWYPQNLEGLTMCYVNAVPFFRATVLSTAMYGAGLFGITALAAHTSPRQVPQLS